MARLGLWLFSALFFEMAVGAPLYAQDVQPAASRREVAVTFDDLPATRLIRSCDLDAIREMTAKLLDIAAKHQVPLVGFVNEGKCEKLPQEALETILQMWLDAGMELGNHSYSHFDLNDTGLDRYQADVIRGESTTKRLLEARGRQLRYFRHPFLHAGKDLETKRAFESFLRERGYRVAPVTIDNQEWVFAKAYARAKRKGDEETAERISKAYLPYMKEVFEFFEAYSRHTVGHEIPQVLVLHANALNADHFEQLITMMKERGYRFVSMANALQDRAYLSADNYAGPEGLSWLHRWAITKGMEISREPREPEWLAALLRSY